jgi:hypothetical protein
MNKVFLEINPRFQELSLSNTLLIDDCSYKCVGNVPFSYIIPQPFDPEVEDNYLLAIFSWVVEGSKYFKVHWL